MRTPAPLFSGSTIVGATLTATPGSWSLTSGTEYSDAWLRGAAVVGTARTYALRYSGTVLGDTGSIRVSVPR